MFRHVLLLFSSPLYVLVNRLLRDGRGRRLVAMRQQPDTMDGLAVLDSSWPWWELSSVYG